MADKFCSSQGHHRRRAVMTEDEWLDVTRFTRAEVIECIRAGYRKIYAGYADGRAPDLHCWTAAPGGKLGSGGHDIGDLVIDRVDADADTGIVKMWISS